VVDTAFFGEHSSAFFHFVLFLGPQYFSDLRNSIVNSQPPEKQQAMHLCFENLMEGIERNLLTKNRDR
jgi:exportin-7